MKVNPILLLSAIVLTTSSCGGFLQSSKDQQTPIDEVIVGYKRALVIAQEKSFFEEFVKYKELHSTFSLYKIDEYNIEATTSIKKSTSRKGEATIEGPIKGILGVTKTLDVGDEKGTKITLTLKPLDSAKVYNAIKLIFDAAPGLNVTYGIVYHDSSGNPTSLENENKCKESVYCVPINNLKDSQNHVGFAYVVNYEELRKLLDEVNKIDIPNEAKGTDKVKKE